MARDADLKIDSGIYVVSALLVLAIARTTELYTFRVWANFAAPGYLIAAATAIAVSSGRPRTGRTAMRLRVGIAAFSLAAAVVMPLAYEVHARADGHIHLEQSEVVVIEQAATGLAAGQDPYTATFDERGLESRPQAQHHFAYLPLMLAFGLPRAFFGPGQLTDARVVMALVTLAALATALARWPATPARRLRMAQIAIVLPSGALFMATGGDDLPVLALVLLGLVMLQRKDRLAWPVLVAAALLKQTAWPVLLIVLLSRLIDRATPGQPARGEVPGAWLIPAMLVSVPFLIWQPGAFVRGAVLFPLGLTSGPAPDQPPTLGSWLTGTAGIAGHHALQIVLVAGLPGAVLAAAAAALLRWGRLASIRTAEQACFASLLMLALIVTSRISRVGFLIYPLDLLTLGLLMRTMAPGPELIPPASSRPDAVIAAAARFVVPARYRIRGLPVLGARRALSPEEHYIG